MAHGVFAVFGCWILFYVLCRVIIAVCNNSKHETNAAEYQSAPYCGQYGWFLSLSDHRCDLKQLT